MHDSVSSQRVAFTVNTFVVRDAYAMLRQPEAWATGGRFVGVEPGALQLWCGRKRTSVRVQVERWSGRPPIAEGWEDRDEVLLPLVGDEPLTLEGSDPGISHAEPLGVTGLDRAVVEVLARGRYRYDSHDDFGEYSPEEWLIRLWPEPVPGETRALSLGPRRLIRLSPEPISRSAWTIACRGWRSRGWGIADHPDAARLRDLLEQAGGPLDVVALVGSVGEAQVDAVTWRTAPLTTLHSALPPARRRAIELLAEAASRPLATYGDLIDAYVRLGLFLLTDCSGRFLLAPNPAPPHAEEILNLTVPESRASRISALVDHQSDALDLATVLRPDAHRPTTVTMHELEMRLGLDLTQIRAGLAVLQLTDAISVAPDPAAAAQHTPMTIVWSGK